VVELSLPYQRSVCLSRYLLYRGEQKVNLGWSPVVFRLVSDLTQFGPADLKQTPANGETTMTVLEWPPGIL